MAGLRALVLLGLSGCSFALVQSAPEGHERMAYFECTSSWLGPGLDAAFTALTGLLAVSLAARTDEEWRMNADDPDTPEVEEPPYSRKFGIGLWGTLAALGAGGVYWGVSRVTHCAEAKAVMVTRLRPNSWPEVPAPAPAPAPTGGASAPSPPASPR